MVVMIVSMAFTLLVLILSLFTISKGYAFKHSIDPIDPLPEDDEILESNHKKNNLTV